MEEEKSVLEILAEIRENELEGFPEEAKDGFMEMIKFMILAS